MATGGSRFTVETLVGSGATASVWRAFDRETRQWVALKVGHQPTLGGVLAAEAERLALVASPALPAVVAVGLLDADDLAGVPAAGRPAAAPRESRPYVALEWREGEPLASALASSTIDPVRQALCVARDVAEALQALHAMGLAHGDLKPANILVSERAGDLRAALIDLGLGAEASLSAPQGGTPRYLAPEVFEPGITGDGRKRDLWALGLTLAETVSPALARTVDPRARVQGTRLPEALERLLRPLLSEAPGARPDAAWVRRGALRALGEQDPPERALNRRLEQVRQAYLRVRRDEVLRAARHAQVQIDVEGEPARWLTQTVAALRAVALLRGEALSQRALCLSDLDGAGRSRWLLELVGSVACRWPSLEEPSDRELALRLQDAVRRTEPHALGYQALHPPTASHAAAEPLPRDPVGVALALHTPHPSEALLEAAEALVSTPECAPQLALAVGRALRLRGHFARALSLLEALDHPSALLEAAECARRAADGGRALALLARAEAAASQTAEPPARVLDGVLALRARLALDSGALQPAMAAALSAARSVAARETLALVELARGEADVARATAEAAMTLAPDGEQRCRLEAVVANCHHRSGASQAALEAFQRAVEQAEQAGAVLEEATYLTGVAAAAHDVGQLALALHAGRRAELLFGQLERPAAAARAALSSAAAYASAGCSPLTLEAAERAIELASRSGDVRCAAFAHLSCVEALRAAEPAAALRHLAEARALLVQPTPSDALRLAACSLRLGVPVPLAEHDGAGWSGELELGARLDWWTARALTSLKLPTPARPDSIVSALRALAAQGGPVTARGEAMAHGARLAARIGDGEATRELARLALDAARRLEAGVPPELRAGLAALEWTRALQAPDPARLPASHLDEIEGLVRALGERRHLRALFDQILDALVLWTGVERGLLLLRAPGGRLVPRAARNLDRADLHGQQLALSHSLAERALLTGEPVVAVDATGELPEVHSSVHALALRSVLAVPLQARGEALGVVYLDDRARRGAFGPSELASVRFVATLAAMAISDARAQLLLRRAARRAQRAEQRLRENLSLREAELDATRAELAERSGSRTAHRRFAALLGESPAMLALLRTLDRLVTTDAPVLVCGESGSGKELVARALHEHGPRANAAFVTENCAAIPEPLLESTLFGHVRGAFTGASRPRAGLFEIADGGTLFLDEVGEMSLAMQSKLLRVLERGELRPVGAERVKRVDVRVITATHRDLHQMAASGEFRQDLLYRLDVLTLRVPPLRERTGDVEVLARHFLQELAGERKVRLSRAATELLVRYAWPGNVRQLQNELRRALVMADDVILPEHLSRELSAKDAAAAATDESMNLRERLDALEVELVTRALAETSGNQTRAALALGVSRFGLQKMMKRLAIDPGRVSAGTTRHRQA